MQTTTSRKWAYFVQPHLGGTYTVYASLRKGLSEYGIELRWLSVGNGAQSVLGDPAWRDEGIHGEVVATASTTDSGLGRAFVQHIIDKQYDGVFVNVLADRLQTNSVRFLPEHILRIMIVHNTTPGTYAAASAIERHVHAIVGVSPRIATDLVSLHGFDPGRMRTILNAIALEHFAEQARVESTDNMLRVLSLGRIEDRSKGVFWLPKILKLLDGEPIRLTVAGAGPDEAELRRRCRQLEDRVRFHGVVAPRDVSSILSCHDVFLFPSRYEGLPQTIVEAMAGGCVPVASRLRGVTDIIIKHEEDGLLFDVGDSRAAGEAIRSLARDRTRLEMMSIRARANVGGRFGLPAQAAAYAALIEVLTDSRPTISPPLPLAGWAYPRGLRPRMASYLPERLKNVARTWHAKNGRMRLPWGR